MNIKQTVHFRTRCIERGIDFEHVKQAVENPDIKSGTLDGKTKVTKHLEVKTIEVIYVECMTSNYQIGYLLITAYYI